MLRNTKFACGLIVLSLLLLAASPRPEPTVVGIGVVPFPTPRTEPTVVGIGVVPFPDKTLPPTDTN